MTPFSVVVVVVVAVVVVVVVVVGKRPKVRVPSLGCLA